MAEEEAFFTRTVQGLGSGLFFVGYLLQIPANLACVALGPRRWLPVLLVAWGGVATCFAAVRSTAAFLTLRLLLGAAEAGAYPAIMFQLSLFYPPRHLGVAYTAVATATAAAGLLGGPLAAGIMALDGAAGLRGYQWLFLLEGIPPILLAVALPCWLPASPLIATFLTPPEQQWLWADVNAADPAGPTASERTQLLAAPKSNKPHLLQLDALLEADEMLCSGGSSDGSMESGGLGLQAAVRRGLQDQRVWVLAAIMALVDVTMNACNFWLPTLVKAVLSGSLQLDGDRMQSSRDSSTGGGGGMGGSPGLAPGPVPDGSAGSGAGLALSIRASLLSALPFVGAAVCMVANAWHARSMDERRLHTALPIVAAALAWATLPLAAGLGPPRALAALTVVASGIWATHGPLFSWPSALLDRNAAAMGFALVKTGGAVGAFIGPFAVGWMADALHGFTAAALVLAGVAAAAAGLVLLFDDRRKG